MNIRNSTRLRARGLLERVRARRAWRRCGRVPAVELAGYGDHTAREAFVETVTRRGGRAEVAVLMADGSDAKARLDVGELDWLDVRAGDIVFVRRGPCGAFSG